MKAAVDAGAAAANQIGKVRIGAYYPATPWRDRRCPGATANSTAAEFSERASLNPGSSAFQNFASQYLNKSTLAIAAILNPADQTRLLRKLFFD